MIQPTEVGPNQAITAGPNLTIIPTDFFGGTKDVLVECRLASEKQ